MTYALATHPGENHVGEEHLFGTATTRDGFAGDAGVWTVSLTKNTTTHAIKGYLKSPGDLKRFDFTVVDHHDADGVRGRRALRTRWAARRRRRPTRRTPRWSSAIRP